MGGTRPERADTSTRMACVAANVRFAEALTAYITAGVPLDSATGQELPVWEQRHVQAVLNLQAALAALVTARRTYDRMRWHARPRGLSGTPGA